MINLNGEEETGNSRMEKGHWVIDIGYNRNERWTWNRQACRHAESNQFRVIDVARIALLVKQGTLPI